MHKTVVGRACRRVHLERFHASADHEPRIDQHQRRELRPRNRNTTSNIQMLARARPFRVSFFDHLNAVAQFSSSSAAVRRRIPAIIGVSR